MDAKIFISTLLSTLSSEPGIPDVVEYPPVVDPADKDKEQPKTPPMWRAVLHNDQTTNVMFVMDVLVDAFSLTVEQANEAAYAAHAQGAATVCVRTKDVIESCIDNARLMVSNAPVGDWGYSCNPNGCELTFSAQPETEGEGSS